MYFMNCCNPMMNSNPWMNFLSMCCKPQNCFSSMNNPFGGFYQQFLNSCLNNCCNSKNCFDIGNCWQSCRGNNSCCDDSTYNTNRSFDCKTNCCTDNNSCSKNCCYSDAFSIYPMMMENCMNLMKQMCNCAQACCKSSYCDDKCSSSGSCSSKSGSCKDNSCHGGHMHHWIKHLECCSSNWAENFGKLSGKMTEFNEQAMQYIDLLNQNIEVMKEKICSDGESCSVENKNQKN